MTQCFDIDIVMGPMITYQRWVTLSCPIEHSKDEHVGGAHPVQATNHGIVTEYNQSELGRGTVMGLK